MGASFLSRGKPSCPVWAQGVEGVPSLVLTLALGQSPSREEPWGDPSLLLPHALGLLLVCVWKRWTSAEVLGAGYQL